MDIKPIRTDADYRAALKAVERVMDAASGSPAGDKLDVLVTLIEAYEAKRFPLDLPDPVATLKFVMEQRGLAAKDLVPQIGGLNRVYEVLNGARPLTLAMIRRLHADLGIPADALIGSEDSRATG
jgi:HTH-type transcriptional regulator/antitoxin HigA